MLLAAEALLVAIVRPARHSSPQISLCAPTSRRDGKVARAFSRARMTRLMSAASSLVSAETDDGQLWCNMLHHHEP
jgi:hypothetical protein